MLTSRFLFRVTLFRLFVSRSFRSGSCLCLCFELLVCKIESRSLVLPSIFSTLLIFKNAVRIYVSFWILVCWAMWVVFQIPQLDSLFLTLC